jgi:tetratricopeptide (TPR) repeat protein
MSSKPALSKERAGFALGGFRIYNGGSMEPLWKSNGVIAGAVVAGAAVVGVALLYTGVIQIGAPQAPSLDEELSISADLPEEVRALLVQNIEKLKSELRTDPTDVGAWLDLAIRYKTAGDFEGAVEIWEYLAAQYPADPVPPHNLGEYYFHTVKDYPRAEQQYLTAITIAPEFPTNYLDLHDMYRYVYLQDSTRAVDILKEALENVDSTQGIDVLIALAGYYNSKGDTENARANYTQARDAAKELGNKALVERLDAELKQLK